MRLGRIKTGERCKTAAHHILRRSRVLHVLSVLHRGEDVAANVRAQRGHRAAPFERLAQRVLQIMNAQLGGWLSVRHAGLSAATRAKRHNRYQTWTQAGQGELSSQ